MGSGRDISMDEFDRERGLEERKGGRNPKPRYPVPPPISTGEYSWWEDTCELSFSKAAWRGTGRTLLGLSKAIRRLKEGLKSEFEAYTCVDEAFPGENETSPGKRKVLR